MAVGKVSHSTRYLGTETDVECHHYDLTNSVLFLLHASAPAEPQYAPSVSATNAFHWFECASGMGDLCS